MIYFRKLTDKNGLVKFYLVKARIDHVLDKNELNQLMVNGDFVVSEHSILEGDIPKNGTIIESNCDTSFSDGFSIPIGTPLGLCDSSGLELKLGSVVRRKSEINKEMHGEWVDYEVTLQGTVPLLTYLRSQKGDVLPKGYTASCLSDFYNLKMFVFSKKSLNLRPEEDFFIIDEEGEILLPSNCCSNIV